MKLDLSLAPQVIYLYGLTGAGKNYVGDLIGKLSTYQVFHADSILTEKMQAAIIQKQVFTPEMRDEYFKNVAEHILDLIKNHQKLVVTQATYKKVHRDFLKKKIPNMDLICVTASLETIVQRLKLRNNQVDLEYAAKMKAEFEAPLENQKVIYNDEIQDSEIIKQLNNFYAKK